MTALGLVVLLVVIALFVILIAAALEEVRGYAARRARDGVEPDNPNDWPDP